jgi:hypothetical protein
MALNPVSNRYEDVARISFRGGVSVAFPENGVPSVEITK